MKEIRKEDVSQDVFDLYDDYAHNRIDRRQFMNKLSAYAIGGITVASLLSFIMPKYEETLQIQLRVVRDDRAVAVGLHGDRVLRSQQRVLGNSRHRGRDVVEGDRVVAQRHGPAGHLDGDVERRHRAALGSMTLGHDDHIGAQLGAAHLGRILRRCGRGDPDAGNRHYHGIPLLCFGFGDCGRAWPRFDQFLHRHCGRRLGLLRPAYSGRGPSG